MQWKLKWKASMAEIVTRKQKSKRRSVGEIDDRGGWGKKTKKQKKKEITLYTKNQWAQTLQEFCYSVSDPGTLGLAAPRFEVGGVPMSWLVTGTGVVIPG